MLTLALPKMFPTTVGMIAKKPPFPIPFMIVNMTSGARDVEIGHIMSMLRALTARDMNKLFKAPALSPRNPQRTRPRADEKLKAATSNAPVFAPSPIDRA